MTSAPAEIEPIDLPRPSERAVLDALTSAGFYPENEPANVLAAEVIRLQEQIERCHSVQRIHAGLAAEWELRAKEEPVSFGARALARAYRDAADELERALR